MTTSKPLPAALIYYMDTGVVHSDYEVGRLADECEVECDSDQTRKNTEAWLVITETYGKGMGSFLHNHFHPDQLAAKTPHLRVTAKFHVDKKGRRIAKYYFHERYYGSGLPDDPLYMDVVNGHRVTTYLKNKRVSASR